MLQRETFLSTLAATPALLALPFGSTDLLPAQGFWTQRVALEIDDQLRRLLWAD
jgi:hypothetical protein